MKRTAIEGLLPAVFTRTLRPGTPLAAVLDTMESLHAQDEEVLARVDLYFDPRRAPAAFVPFLATWVDLARLAPQRPRRRPQKGPGRGQGDPKGPGDSSETAQAPLGEVIAEGRLRELILRAAELSRWRGTGRGLQLFLEIATGVEGFEIDEEILGEDGRVRPFHIRVRVPGRAAPHAGLIRRIVELEKPAHVTAETEILVETETGARTPEKKEAKKRAGRPPNEEV